MGTPHTKPHTRYRLTLDKTNQEHWLKAEDVADGQWHQAFLSISPQAIRIGCFEISREALDFVLKEVKG